MKKQAINTTLTILNVVPLVGIFYFFFIASRYNLAFLCIAIFLVAFFTAVQMTPAKPKLCPHCGCDEKEQIPLEIQKEHRKTTFNDHTRTS